MLSRMVGELILENDQVGLPGLGMFVADVAPASFSDRGYTVNPPFRRLIFHSYCMEDRLLVDMYSSINGVDKETARAYLKDFLSELKMVLQDRKTLAFPGLGRLRLTNNNRYLFISDADLDVFPDGFGLKPISMKTHVNPDEDVHVAAHSLTDQVVRTEPVKHDVVPEPQPVVETVETVPEKKKLGSRDPVSVREHPMALISELSSHSKSDPVVIVKHREQRGKRTNSSFRWWLVPVIVLCVLVIALIAFMIIARTNPEVIYPILYSPEELIIINS